MHESISQPVGQRLPPGHFGLPYVGETRSWIKDPLHFAQQRFAQHGPIWRTHLIRRPCIAMLGPEANAFILHSQRQLFSSRDGWGDSLYQLIGEGLSLQDGPRHDQRRLVLQPAFHAQALAHYFYAMREHTFQHIEQWLTQASLPMFDGFKKLTFAIASQVLLGLAPGPDLNELEHHFNIFNAGLFGLLPWDVAWTPFGQAARARQHLDQTIRGIIASRRNNPGVDALGLLMQATDQDGTAISESEIVSQIILLLWAGHDTITSLLTWVIFELHQHPQIIAELRAEQQAVIGSGPLQLEHLRRLPALDRVLRETERLHPPASDGFRGVRESFEWGGYHIPAGWNVMYSIVFTHYDPRTFTNPFAFEPDRFGPVRNEGRQPYTMIGFGGGPRVCIGIAMAQMEMRILVTTMLRHLDIEVLPNQNLRPVVTPTKRPKDRLLVRITKHSA